MSRREPLLSQEPWPKVCDFGVCRSLVEVYVIALVADERDLIKQVRMGLCGTHAPRQVEMLVEDIVAGAGTRGLTVVLP